MKHVLTAPKALLYHSMEHILKDSLHSSMKCSWLASQTPQERCPAPHWAWQHGQLGLHFFDVEIDWVQDMYPYNSRTLRICGVRTPKKFHSKSRSIYMCFKEFSGAPKNNPQSSGRAKPLRICQTNSALRIFGVDNPAQDVPQPSYQLRWPLLRFSLPWEPFS